MNPLAADSHSTQSHSADGAHPGGGSDSGPSSLTELIDLDVLQQLQDSFSRITLLNTCILNADGSQATRPSFGFGVCRVLHTNPQAAAECMRWQQQAARDSGINVHVDESSGVQTDQQICHVGTSHHTANIHIDGVHLGTIVVSDGVAREIDDDTLEVLAGKYDLDIHELRQARRDMEESRGKGSSQAAYDFLNLLAQTVATMCHQQAELRRRIEELSAVYQVASLQDARRDLQDIVDRICAQVAQVMHVAACTLRLYDQQTHELHVKGAHGLSAEYLQKGPVKIEDSQIDQAAMHGEAVYIDNMADDPRVLYPRESMSEGLQTGMIMGLIHREQPIGVLHVYRRRRQRFSSFEVSCLRAICSLAATAIVNARLQEEAIKAERTNHQVRLAREIQQRMMARKLPRLDGGQIGAVYESCLELGGDFYDVMNLPDDNIGIAIGDVVGKGIPAALLMASVRGAIRAHVRSIYSISQIMELINRDLYQDTEISEFATAFYAVFNCRTGRLTYVNCGHEPPFLVRGGRVEMLPGTCPLLGVMPDARYEEQTLDLRRGDALLLYTDGLIDAVNFDGQFFGRDRAMRCVLERSTLSAQEMANQVLWDVRRYTGLAQQNDDITLLAMNFGDHQRT